MLQKLRLRQYQVVDVRGRSRKMHASNVAFKRAQDGHGRWSSCGTSFVRTSNEFHYVFANMLSEILLIIECFLYFRVEWDIEIFVPTLLKVRKIQKLHLGKLNSFWIFPILRPACNLRDSDIRQLMWRLLAPFEKPKVAALPLLPRWCQ